MKNRLFEKNNVYPNDLTQLLGKKVEFLLRDKEPIVGVLDTCNDSSVKFIICGHSFIINRNDILDVRCI